MSFVRSGWRNPNAESPRSTLQFVNYVFKNGALIRRARIYLDDASRSDEIERVLFDGLDDASAAFLIGETQGELDWADIWPVSSEDAPPKAVSLTLEWPTGEPLVQLFWIGEMGGGS